MSVVASASVMGAASAQPDVWVCSLPTTFYWGQTSGVHAFSVGTTSANAGNVDLNWLQNGTQHPVIGQNMYRLKDGVMEQIGMSWLKHGFCALQQNLGCGVCSNPTGKCLSILRPGCSDPYLATLNGAQSGLGPRSEVNPTTGDFAWPFTVADEDPVTPGNQTFIKTARLQVLQADILPGLNPGARWFVEGQYVHPQDAGADNDDNNVSYREIGVVGFSFIPNQPLANIGGTVGMKSVIEGWADIDPSVLLTPVDVPGTGGGRVFVASKAFDNGDGTWRYEYAVYNMNADRAIGSLDVPVSDARAVSLIGFHDVPYHSGEPYDGTDWPGSHAAGAVAWSTADFATNANANAVRWGTMYNFRFTADAPPAASPASATLGLFKPGGAGDPATVSADVIVPGAAPCVADLNGDGVVNGGDITNILNAFGATGPGLAEDLNGDQTVNGADITSVLNAFGACP
ncbi:MAG: hypothetical protein D6693_09150 [Planctomycetota bacterium]|nr:MAG: hypothetical protein D6693_09150 [Planctomycetota bacterium]